MGVLYKSEAFLLLAVNRITSSILNQSGRPTGNGNEQPRVEPSGTLASQLWDLFQFLLNTS